MQALFSFHGRINRLQFVGLYFAQFAVVTGLALVGGVGVFLSLRAHNPLLIIPMIAPALVASLWMWFAISWKRMADIGVPRSLRRLLQLFWAVAGAIVMAVYGHSLLVRTLLGLVPLLMLALWPGQSDDDDLLATFGAPDPSPTTSPVRKVADFARPSLLPVSASTVS